METLENLLCELADSLYILIAGCFVCFIDKYLFLKDYTKEQKRKIQIFFYISVVATIITISVCFIDILYDLDFTSEIFFTYLEYTLILFVMYTNMAGRKKAKWLGILFAIPLSGYAKMLEFISSFIDFLPLQSYISIYIINIIFSIFLFIVMFYLSNEKTKPKFIRNFENDIKKYELYRCGSGRNMANRYLVNYLY